MTTMPVTIESMDIFPQLAVIRENECIGCTKCIQACPVDAIMGAAKLMHTVITDECIGCGLCLSPCPVDCIDLISTPIQSIEKKNQKINHAKMRFQARNLRLAQKKKKKLDDDTPKMRRISQDEINALIARVLAKKMR